ncbi:MAG: class IV adenylate cyclase [Halovenus sp.]|uniref:class IV adenylate cyclase n=1 Tax=Halovenus amylolytica TaxID=2500550 RepID=UPI000FE33DA3
MYEVELKVRADHDTVGERLDEIGAQRIGTVSQEDVYYDAPDRDFAETDEALRIRTESADEPVTRLTYKGPLVESESKTRQEAETAVADPAEIRAILDGLGYEPAATVRKDREQYAVDGCTVTLDAVDGLGEFVEAELEVEDGIDEARGRLETVLEKLGLDPEDQIRTSYLGLLLAEADADPTDP